jgi:glycosyltransferase involved in cell wall biosynthesis
MRVANVLFDDRFGGPQKRVIEVGERLKRRGIETVVILPDKQGNAGSIAGAKQLEVRHVNFARIPRLSAPLDLLLWIFTLPRDVVRFARVFRSCRVDMVHVNGAFFLAPAIAAKLLGMKLLWHLNDTIVPEPLASVLGRMVRLFGDRIAVAAQAVARHYSIPESRFHILYAPVDVEKYTGQHDAFDAPQGSTGRFQVAFVGNWNPVKGIEYYLEAIAEVRDRGVAVEGVMAGARLFTQAEYAARLDRMIAERDLAPSLEIHGFVDDIPRLLGSADALVLSSTSEACPMVVLEAMAMGKPVIATDVGGVRELLKPDVGGDVAGIVVSRADASAIADAIVRLCEDPGQAKMLGRNGRRIVEREFALDVCVSRHAELYTQLVSGLSVQPGAGH